MSANSSSSSPHHGSVPPSSFSSSFYIYSFMQTCINSTVGTVNMTMSTITSVVFLLPLYIFVLYLGLQRWRQRRSGTMMSHSDVFTYHMAVIELMSVFGSTLSCFGVYTDLTEMVLVGICLFSINVLGKIFLHVLTCVERYLAVVHPVTYLSLRKAKGIRIRNISIGCTWLLCLAMTPVLFTMDRYVSTIITFTVLTIVLAVTSFCSLSVLCVLIRPRPGEGGRGRQRVDQSKLRALYTIMAILGALVFRFGANIVTSALNDSLLIGTDESCGLWLSFIWFSLPSSLVLPLLFLQRARKLLCCENNNKPGHGPS